MSRRINLYGFSRSQMQALCNSQNEEALKQMRSKIAKDFKRGNPEYRERIVKTIEQAIMTGTPFADLQQETWIHSIAAKIIGFHQQEILVTDASNYHASALEEGLCGTYRKLAKPEVAAFLRALINGIPMFGRESTTDGSTYTIISLDRLQIFQPGMRELVDKIAYRVKQNSSADEDEITGAEFASDFCGWIEEIIAAERDLFFEVG